ncbi:MAG: hypothetical protein NDI81_13430 [Desulfobacula sp.]|nr:hypothetical protein [Desulfobacula sp.]
MEKELGKSLKVKEVAEFLGVNEKTVRQYYKKLGGMRLGSRYIFFEGRVLNAISNEEWELEGPGEKEWEEKGTNVQDEKRGNSMGKQPSAVRRRVGREDRHNLFS